MKKYILVLLSILAIFTLSACTKVEPKLIGDETITVEVGDTYTDEGVTEGTVDVTTEGTVNTEVIGVYEITYSYTFDGEDKVITRTVTVVDTTVPVITISGGDVTLTVGDAYTDAGATASDNYDGDITSDIVTVNPVDTSNVGVYTVTYDVDDSSGNEAVTVSRTVTINEVLDAPVITLVGDNPLNLEVGDTYTEPGATALDDEDGDLTSSIIITGTVDTSVAGTYTVSYNVTDSDSMSATTVTRTVNVTEPYVNQAPVLTLTGDATITIMVNDPYVELGATAMDTEDGSLTLEVLATEITDTSVPGTYIITYTVVDSEGLAATPITRTLIILEPDPGQIYHLYVEQGSTITLDDLFTEISATPSSPPSIDVNTLGDTIVVTDIGEVTVTIFNRTEEINIMPNNLVLFRARNNDSFYTGTITFPDSQECEVSIETEDHTEFIIYDLMFEDILLVNTFNHTSNASLLINDGIYNFDIYNSAFEERNVIVKVTTKGYFEELDPYEVMINSASTVNSGEYITEIVFDVETAGDLEVSVNTYGDYYVEIFDSSDNLIKSGEGLYDEGFRHYGNFAIGNYKVVVTQFDINARINILVHSNQPIINNNINNAQPLSLNVINELQTLYRSNWYTFEILEEGYYDIQVPYTTTWLHMYHVYDENYQQVDTSTSLLHLTPGMYYINYDYIKGEIDVLIEEVVPLPSPNNTSTTAATVTLGNEEEVYFDGSNIYKWYTFTLTETKTIRLSVSSLFMSSPMVHLYKEGSLITDMPRYNAVLESGTYTLRIKGESNSMTKFMVEEINPTIGSDDMHNPDLINLDEEYFYLLPSMSVHYVQFTLTETSLIEVAGNSNDDVSYVLFTSDYNYIERGSLDSWEPSLHYLDPGSYVLYIENGYINNETYTLAIKPVVQTDEILSTDINNPAPFTTSSGYLYVPSEEITLYQTITVTETTYVGGWIGNIRRIDVINNGRVVQIKSDEEMDMFPIILEAGTYILKYYPYEAGVIFSEGFYTESISNSIGTFGFPTALERFRSLEVYTPSPYDADVYTITVSEDAFYEIENESNEAVYYYLLDSNNDIVFYHNSEGRHAFLETGTYTLIVNTYGQYYNIDIYNETSNSSGTSFATAKELYPIQGNSVIYNQHEDNYFKFTIGIDTYLDIDYEYDYTIEVFDSNENPVNGLYFTAGTYYLRITYNDTPSMDEPYESRSLDIDVLLQPNNNSMATATPIVFGQSYNGDFIDPVVTHWYEVTLPINALLHRNGGISNGGFNLYDDMGTLIETGFSNRLLDPGTYYVEAYSEKGNFEVSFDYTLYTDIGDDYLTAEDLPITDYSKVSSFIEDSSDLDFYHINVTQRTLLQFNFHGVTLKLYDNVGVYIKDISSNSYEVLDIGNYYIEVSRTGSYEYSFTMRDFTERLMPDTSGTAEELLLEIEYAGFRDPDGSLDWYKVNITYNLTLETPDFADYTLYDSTLTEVLTLDLTPGVYYFEVDPIVDGMYYFTISEEPYEEDLTPDELTNTYSTPEVINDLLFTLHQYSAVAMTPDFFEITVTEELVYRFEQWGTETEIKIYNSIDTLIYTSGDEGGYIHLYPGVYIIELNTADSDSVYEILFRLEPQTFVSDNILYPYELELYEFITSILEVGDTHYYTFTLDEETLLNIYRFDGNLEIYSDNTFLTLVHDFADNDIVLLDAGTYYFRIDPSIMANERYQIVLEEVQAINLPTSSGEAMSIDLTEDWTYFNYYSNGVDTYFVTFTTTETTTLDFDGDADPMVLDNSLVPVLNMELVPGTYYLAFDDTDAVHEFAVRNIHPLLHSTSTPTPITFNELVKGFGEDYLEYNFSFTLTEQTALYLDYHGPDYSRIAFTYTSGVELLYFSCGSNSCDPEIIILPAGDYYIKASQMDWDEYQFTLYELSGFLEESNTIAGATSIELDQEVRVYHHYYEDPDVFALTLTSDTDIEIEYEGFGHTVIVTDAAGTPIPITSGYYACTAGTVYIWATSTNFQSDSTFTVIEYIVGP